MNTGIRHTHILEIWKKKHKKSFSFHPTTKIRLKFSFIFYTYFFSFVSFVKWKLNYSGECHVQITIDRDPNDGKKKNKKSKKTKITKLQRKICSFFFSEQLIVLLSLFIFNHFRFISVHISLFVCRHFHFVFDFHISAIILVLIFNLTDNEFDFEISVFHTNRKQINCDFSIQFCFVQVLILFCLKIQKNPLRNSFTCKFSISHPFAIYVEKFFFCCFCLNLSFFVCLLYTHHSVCCSTHCGNCLWAVEYQFVQTF